ncbi:MAG TPA: SusC/RagA family TonB-linked outer membrane protein, partial [Myxococcales bacterium]|nr:SusC/RagA family TonB-linked outer membrane protein [Myxococcales bacterium]
SGAAGATTYYASGILKGDKGIISGTGYDKQGLRLNLDRRLGDALELSLGTNVLHTLARRGVANDNPGVSPYTVLSSTPSFFDLQPNATGSYPANPFAGAVETNPLQTAGLMKNDEDVWRLLGSAGARWRLWSSAHHELKLQLGLGADRFQQTNDILFPAALFFEPLDGLPGTALFASTEVLNVNAGAHLVHTFRPSGHGWLSSATTSAGYQQESQDRSSAYVASRSIPSGSQNVGSGLQITVTQNRRRVLDRGFYLQEEALALGERLYLVAALRAEQSSLDGNPRALDLFPRGAASYRVPGLPSPFDELKLRAAYGETGNLSPYGNALTPPPGTMPLKDIHPERQRELEVGVDALMFSGTTIAELTAYQEVVSDLILQRPLAPATGFTTEIVQGGELVNRGVEAMLQVTPFQSAGGATWTSRATFALNRSLVTRLPIPAFNTGGFGVAAGTFRIEQGQSATQIAGHDVDENGNLVVTKLGDAEPDFRMSFLNDVRYGAFTLSTSFEWQQGSQVINLTRLLYDAAGNSPDDVTAGSARFNRWLNGRTREYVEDATFFKVREVTLSYEIPPSFYDRYLEAVRHARVSVSGRNLLAFTPYSGLDPEVSNFGNQPIARNIDLAPFPPSRSLWASIQLGF